MRRILRRVLFGAALCLVLAACGNLGDFPTPAATPLPLPTRTPRPPSPTAFPRPTATLPGRGAICQFPADVNGDGRLENAGIYRFFWRGEPITLNTGAGKITLQGAADLPVGPRDLILLFDGAPLSALPLPATLPPNGAVLYDPAAQALEYRTAEGGVLAQRLQDPPNDGLFAINQDILSLQRDFGPTGAFTLTLEVRGQRGIRLETLYEAWQVTLGEQTYEYRVHRNKTAAAYVNVDGEPVLYDGPATFDGQRLALAFQDGADLPFRAFTYTTANVGDQTALFPLTQLQQLYPAAYAACGP